MPLNAGLLNFHLAHKALRNKVSLALKSEDGFQVHNFKAHIIHNIQPILENRTLWRALLFILQS